MEAGGGKGLIPAVTSPIIFFVSIQVKVNHVVICFLSLHLNSIMTLAVTVIVNKRPKKEWHLLLCLLACLFRAYFLCLRLLQMLQVGKKQSDILYLNYDYCVFTQWEGFVVGTV